MNWSSLRHFKPSEFNYPDKMDTEFLWFIDLLRHAIGMPFYATSDFRPGDKRLHGKGRALDFGIPYAVKPWTQYWRISEKAHLLALTFEVSVELEIVHNTDKDIIPGRDMHLHVGLFTGKRDSALVILPT